MTVTPEIDTFAFPVLVIVAVRELLLPTCTFPKLTLEEDRLSDCVAEVPVPVRPIEICAGEPLVSSVIEPVDGAAEDGVKTTVKLSDPPAAIVLDVVSPEMLKPDPLTPA